MRVKNHPLAVLHLMHFHVERQSGLDAYGGILPDLSRFNAIFDGLEDNSIREVCTRLFRCGNQLMQELCLQRLELLQRVAAPWIQRS